MEAPAQGQALLSQALGQPGGPQAPEVGGMGQDGLDGVRSHSFSSFFPRWRWTSASAACRRSFSARRRASRATKFFNSRNFLRSRRLRGFCSKQATSMAMVSSCAEPLLGFVLGCRGLVILAPGLRRATPQGGEPDVEHVGDQDSLVARGQMPVADPIELAEVHPACPGQVGHEPEAGPEARHVKRPLLKNQVVARLVYAHETETYRIAIRASNRDLTGRLDQLVSSYQ